MQRAGLTYWIEDTDYRTVSYHHIWPDQEEAAEIMYTGRTHWAVMVSMGVYSKVYIKKSRMFHMLCTYLVMLPC